MPWSVRLLLLAVLLGCGAQRPLPCVAGRGASEPPRRATARSLVALPGSRPPPSPSAAEQSPCMLHGLVSPHGVAWKLRTRLDAIPTLQLDDGFVTASLEPGVRRYQPRARVQAENSAMRLRALVATDDLKVVVTQAFTSLPGHIPDGLTHRQVLEIDGDQALLDIRIEGAIGTVSTLPCTSLGFEPNDVRAERLLPPARGKVVVKSGASVKTDSDFVPVRSFFNPFGASEPAGVLAELRGDDADSTARLVSFDICGGVVFGFVSKSDLLGRPRTLHGSNGRCPDTGPGIFVSRPQLERLVSCPNDLPVFIRSATLEDPVGALKARARFRVDGHEAGGTTLVTVESPPALPLGDASFSIQSEALEQCITRERR